MIRFAMMALVLAVVGCGPIYETVYSYQPPRSGEGKMCVGQCQQTNRYCVQNCRLTEQTCKANAERQASYDYERYVREQHRNHQEIKKSVSDFNYGYCSSSSSCESECGGDYRMCYTNCGGTVSSHQECTMFCDQLKDQGKR